jgi:hypothetical protein
MITQILDNIKRCSKCKEYKSVKEFSPNKKHKDKLASHCKECRNKTARIYHQQYLEKCRKNSRQRQQKWRKENPEKYQIGLEQYHSTIRGYTRRLYHRIKIRCENPKHPKYKYYGGRGIECLFKNADEFIEYVIDELHVDPRKLETHRIDNNGHYTFGNIEFLTQAEHLKKHGKLSKHIA